MPASATVVPVIHVTASRSRGCAREVGLSHDIFADVMSARDHQTRWLAELVDRFDGRVAVLGKAFKADSNVTAG